MYSLLYLCFSLQVRFELVQQGAGTVELEGQDSLALRNSSVNLKGALHVVLVNLGQLLLHVAQLGLGRLVTHVVPLLEAVLGVGEAAVEGHQRLSDMVLGLGVAVVTMTAHGGFGFSLV